MVTIQQVVYKKDQTAEQLNTEIASIINDFKKNNKVYKIGIQTIPGVIVGINGNNPIIIGRTGMLFFDTSDYGEILSVSVEEDKKNSEGKIIVTGNFNSLRTEDTFYFRLDIIAEGVE